MSRKNGYRLTPANTRVDVYRVQQGERRQKRLEAQADEILANNKANKAKRRDRAARKPKTGSLFEQKRRATDKYADFDAIVSIDDQNHMDSITQWP